jgi:GNAT superfamily N-acetyltransferase
VNVSWLDPAHLQERQVAGAVALLEAARLTDNPEQLGPTVGGFIADLRHGWDGDAADTAVAEDHRGRVIGVLAALLPRWDNRHLGWLEITVDPPARRQGVGRRLFSEALDRIRAEHRTLVVAGSFDQPAGVSFMQAMGLQRASVEAQRRLHLDILDWPELDRQMHCAQRHADGYELLRIAGDTPQDLIAGVVALTAAINDAPTDDLEIEHEVFSEERIRAFEAAQLGHNRRIYRLVACHPGTGVLAGHTMVGVEAERPWYGWQYDTSVVREHRGHRLGLFLKIAMLRWLAEQEPQLRYLETWNAASNGHMIRVNEILGYQHIAEVIECQRRL